MVAMSTADDDTLPGIPNVGKADLDAMVEKERPDPREELADVEADTDLGVAMAEDAQRVARGELSGDEYWEKYDEAAAAEFGEAYQETPNPAVDAGDQTVSTETAESLSCAVGSMDTVATESTQVEGDGPDGGIGAGDEKWGMVIDLQKCVGCDSCTVACKSENRTPPGVSYNVVMEEEHGEFPNVTRTNVPRPCMQCDNPPCVQVCPVSATYKMDDGVVNIDYDRCIGCRYCNIACPYGARYFDFGENYDDEVDGAGELTSSEYGVDRGPREEGKSPIGNIRKCSFCTHRLERGEEPACVETCVGDARNMGDLENPDSDVAQMADSSRAFQLKEDEGTDPNVYYLK
ncbi:4Fe-4S ferredoxin iron-sulfur-binding domain-containing protein [Halorubrum distributum JCM 9100]|uniref:4Fe-4S ferredoxin iron-sulfur-binding domain-containing protein n=4 Tax=Halorubrum distributum TaxID=29283 RepID=M0EM03_9EURY|nr:4Fe-4S ferredoxin iron-sulfur-binding domain-containing protein [Halorubrum terrestre JCM 10247]ELZ48770.1 4Fe-4S ferredoxin iron-sulfur-binding domain-containing protein [Halorubrum distributum JCM 9100]ELZ51883.1 4Fe-4S ferredoxin iron-sulfur-binding domain-containing protein [Halorubrum distributum JCM 10118]PHQ46973.1 4Fe-4S ferredoxin [Halorubrum sp. C3]